MGNSNNSLNRAKEARQDEFYTQLADIERELRHYRQHFKGKTVLCNCDDPFESNFFRYFVLNFNKLGLKKLIATCYDGSPIAGTQASLFDLGGTTKPEDGRKPYKAVVTSVRDATGDGALTMDDIAALFRTGANSIEELDGNGDYASPECLELLDEADIVATNPPFSLFREYVATLVKHDKKFVIIGSTNAITYKEIFPLLMHDKMWLGYGFQKGDAYFAIPKGNANAYAKGVYDPETGLVHFRNCCWFTNLDIKKRHEEMILVKCYRNHESSYPSYINFDGIECKRVSDIPCDYSGNIGVTPGFMASYNPDQFEIIGSDTMLRRPMEGLAAPGEYNPGGNVFYYEDPAPNAPFRYKAAYKRVVIRNRHPETPEA